MELSKMEQRYQAVMAVQVGGLTVTEVADKFGVSRQPVHEWLRRCERAGWRRGGEGGGGAGRGGGPGGGGGGRSRRPPQQRGRRAGADGGGRLHEGIRGDGGAGDVHRICQRLSRWRAQQDVQLGCEPINSEWPA